MVFGYGVSPYGTSTYGSGEVGWSLFSVSPTTSDIVFAEDMDFTSDILVIASYAVTPIRAGVLTIVGVSQLGVRTIRLTHTPATIGGLYEVEIPGNVLSLSGAPAESAPRELLTVGQIPTFTASALDASTVLINFSEDIEPSASVIDVASYDTTLTVNTASQTLNDEVELNVSNFMAIAYTLEISPAEAITYTSTGLPGAGSSVIGSGASAIVSNRLSLNKTAGNTYGYSFADATARMVAGSNYRSSLVFDFSGTTILPSSSGLVWTYTISDGTTQVRLEFLFDDQIQLVSGANTEIINFAWKTQEFTIDVIRNQRAGFYAVLIDDVPYANVELAFAIEASSIAAGYSFVLDSVYEIVGATYGDSRLDSSSTIFTQSLNFYHNATSNFLGISGATKDTLYTQNGPLTKGWGDATPATINDVEVRVNGSPVTLASVNPYNGEVVLATPLAAGAYTVEVDYFYIKEPIMAFAGLNTPGLVLNQYGQNSPNFPLCTTLNGLARNQPITREHRYLAFDAKQTASLNRPQSLLLNQNPRRERNAPLEYRYIEQGNFYPAEADPLLEWEREGTDSGSVSGGVWDLVPTGEVSYSRNLIAESAATYRMNVRFSSGVATCFFGFHNGYRNLQVSLKTLNGLNHLVFLQEDGTDLVAGAQSSEIVAADTIRVLQSNFFEVNTQFQILSGNQTGVYTVQAITDVDDTYSDLTITTTFPADFNNFGNRFVMSYPEIDFNQTFTLEADYSSGTAFLESQEGALISSLDVTTLDLVDESEKNGRVFWGSSANSSWSFVQYNVSPSIEKEAGFSSITSSEMDVLPHLDPNSPWIYEINNARDTIESNTLRVRKLQEQNHVYKRREFLFLENAEFDLDGIFRSTEFVGTDQIVRIRTPEKEIILGALLYREDTPSRQLLDVPFLSSDDSGWTISGSSTLTTATTRRTTQILGESGSYENTLDLTGIQFADTLDRVLLATINIEESTENLSDETGIFVELEAGNEKPVLTFLANPNRLSLGFLTGSTYTAVQNYVFDWTGEHTYKIIASQTSNSVSLLADDTLQLPITALLGTGAGADDVRYGHYTTDTTATVSWDQVHYQVQVPTFAKRTFGIYLGGDISEINSWELPRTDSLTVDNADLTAVVEEMDWTSDAEFRVHLDLGWGVTFFRPDLPNPPFFSADFATEITNPSQGWINVEFQNIPSYFEGVATTATGVVAFGSFTTNPTEQFWDYVRYRIYRRERQTSLSSRYMKLNQHGVLSHPYTDRTVDSFTVTPTESNRISLYQFNLFAAKMLFIQDGGTTLQAGTDFTFIVQSQEILLPTGTTFQNDQVTLNFLAKRKHTVTTVQAQDTDLKLYPNTPIYEIGQSQSVSISTVAGSVLTDDKGFPDVTADFIDNTSFSTKEYGVVENQRYECLQVFVTEENTESIEPICECGVTMRLIDPGTQNVVLEIKKP